MARKLLLSFNVPAKSIKILCHNAAAKSETDSQLKAQGVREEGGGSGVTFCSQLKFQE